MIKTEINYIKHHVKKASFKNGKNGSYLDRKDYD